MPCFSWMQQSCALYVNLISNANRKVTSEGISEVLNSFDWLNAGDVSAVEFIGILAEWLNPKKSSRLEQKMKVDTEKVSSIPYYIKPPTPTRSQLKYKSAAATELSKQTDRSSEAKGISLEKESSKISNKTYTLHTLAEFRELLLSKGVSVKKIIQLNNYLGKVWDQKVMGTPIAYRPASMSAHSSMAELEEVTEEWLQLATELFDFFDLSAGGIWGYDECFSFSACICMGHVLECTQRSLAEASPDKYRHEAASTPSKFVDFSVNALGLMTLQVMHDIGASISWQAGSNQHFTPSHRNAHTDLQKKDYGVPTDAVPLKSSGKELGAAHQAAPPNPSRPSKASQRDHFSIESQPLNIQKHMKISDILPVCVTLSMLKKWLFTRRIGTAALRAFVNHAQHVGQLLQFCTTNTSSLHAQRPQHMAAPRSEDGTYHRVHEALLLSQTLASSGNTPKSQSEGVDNSSGNTMPNTDDIDSLSARLAPATVSAPFTPIAQNSTDKHSLVGSHEDDGSGFARTALESAPRSEMSLNPTRVRTTEAQVVMSESVRSCPALWVHAVCTASGVKLSDLHGLIYEEKLLFEKQLRDTGSMSGIAEACIASGSQTLSDVSHSTARLGMSRRQIDRVSYLLADGMREMPAAVWAYSSSPSSVIADTGSSRRGAHDGILDFKALQTGTPRQDPGHFADQRRSSKDARDEPGARRGSVRGYTSSAAGSDVATFKQNDVNNAIEEFTMEQCVKALYEHELTLLIQRLYITEPQSWKPYTLQSEVNANSIRPAPAARSAPEFDTSDPICRMYRAVISEYKALQALYCDCLKEVADMLRILFEDHWNDFSSSLLTTNLHAALVGMTPQNDNILQMWNHLYRMEQHGEPTVPASNPTATSAAVTSETSPVRTTASAAKRQSLHQTKSTSQTTQEDIPTKAPLEFTLKTTNKAESIEEQRRIASECLYNIELELRNNQNTHHKTPRSADDSGVAASVKEDIPDASSPPPPPPPPVEWTSVADPKASYHKDAAAREPTAPTALIPSSPILQKPTPNKPFLVKSKPMKQSNALSVAELAEAGSADAHTATALRHVLRGLKESAISKLDLDDLRTLVASSERIFNKELHTKQHSLPHNVFLEQPLFHNNLTVRNVKDISNAEDLGRYSPDRPNRRLSPTQNGRVKREMTVTLSRTAVVSQTGAKSDSQQVTMHRPSWNKF